MEEEQVKQITKECPRGNEVKNIDDIKYAPPGSPFIIT